MKNGTFAEATASQIVCTASRSTIVAAVFDVGLAVQKVLYFFRVFGAHDATIALRYHHIVEESNEYP